LSSDALRILWLRSFEEWEVIGYAREEASSPRKGKPPAKKDGTNVKLFVPGGQ
jgi:hypothetical protein